MTRSIFISLLLFVAPLMAAGTVAEGQLLVPFAITDQHGQGAMLDDSAQLILFSRDMSANKLVKKAFMDKPGDYLPAHHALYLIDVSGMPRFVTNNFAIPKMQKYPYRIFLDREGMLTTALPAQEGQVTVMVVDRLNVRSIAYASDAAALERAVAAAGAAQ